MLPAATPPSPARSLDCSTSDHPLRERDQLLRAAFDDAPIGMALTALDGRWVRVNQALCEILGYSESELLATTFHAITHPDDLARTRERHRQLLAGECTRYQYEKRYVHRLGHAVWVSVTIALLRDEDGQPRHQLAQIQDVTERVAATEALRASEERFRALTENTTELVSVVDAAGTITYASPSYARILGLEPAALIGVDPFCLIHPDDVAPCRASLARMLEREGESVTTLFRMRDSGGGYRWLEISARNLLGHPAIAGIVCTGRDVTERQQAEEQLRQAQKLEAVGRLAGGVAHDFNNLLMVIQTNASFLLDDIDAVDPRRRDVLQIRDAGERAAGLTRQLLAYSRRQILRPRLVDVNHMVANVAAMLQRVIGEDIRVETDLAPDMWPVFADPGQLEQVLMNLAVNARDAMPDGGTLRLGTAMVEIDAAGARAHPGLVPGQYASLVVQDTGVGIAPDVLPQIFDPFYTTKAVGKGTGLGLSTVHGIVRQSDGYIHVGSVPGRGSHFTVLLPRRAPQRSVDVAAAAPPPRGTERILVVEDERVVRTAVRRMLERLGYRVLEAANGAEALGILDTTMHRIDVVLTDVVMPDVDGRVLAECVEGRTRAPRVLYMSGYTDDDILRRGLACEGTALLQKPFTPDALAHAVRELLDAGVH